MIGKIVLFACFLLFLTVRSADNHMFVALWDAINQQVTPKFPTFNAYVTPSEIFLMNMPGIAIDPDDFDETTFVGKGYVGEDPGYNLCELTDAIPANMPYFVDTGKKVSGMYQIFLRNFVTPKSKSLLTASKQEEVRHAFSKFFKPDFTPSTLAIGLNVTRNNVSNDYQESLLLREQCLLQEAPETCQRAAVLWAEKSRDVAILHLVVQYELLNAHTKLLALSARSLDQMVFEQYEKFTRDYRTGVGAKTLLMPFMVVNYEPSDWWKWWIPDNQNGTAKLAFQDFGSVLNTKRSSSETFTKSQFSNTGTALRTLFSVKTSGNMTKSETSSYSATENGQNVAVSFQIASVKVIRPWFDINIFEYAPLGVAGYAVDSFSDNNYNGVFPWFITKMIVVKNIKVTMSTWESSVETVLTSSTSTLTKTEIAFGPFSATPSTSTSSSTTSTAKKSATSMSFSNGELKIKGPQIIGYTLTKVPAFPNWQEPS